MLQVLQAAMGVGVVMFGGVVLFLSHMMGGGTSAPAKASDVVRMLSLVNAAVFCLLALAAAVLPELVANPGRTFKQAAGAAPSVAPGDLEEAFQWKLGAARVLRLAPLEGSALMGLVVCLLGVMDGSVRADPAYWCNALPAAVFIAYVIATFPTARQVAEIFQRYLARARSPFA
jgi:hypothetical protein